MESSQLFGGTEECSSSESGWTTYIVSPVHSDDTQDEDYDEEDDGDDNDDHDNDGKDSNDDSDDSMASDASTGPNHGEGEDRYENSGEGDHDMTHFKHDQEENDNKCYSYTKAYRQKEKKTDEVRGREAVKQGSVVKADSETSSVHGGVKM
ncbi:hypothetical protein NE237_007678 [Protea cynaroides]|uniref:Uncharacterized protein n=1 Tax=Protea cynaroides TaxID=273540 RepID=A0A9Q0QWQ6_9MAGN|nr:hypothetical protein NE237_007678 [Protea cynaroides]